MAARARRGGQAGRPISRGVPGPPGARDRGDDDPGPQKFVEDGGTIIAIGSSANIAGHLGLPVSSGLVEIVNGVERRLPNDKFYVPGSVLSMDVDPANPLAYGFDDKADVMWRTARH